MSRNRAIIAAVAILSLFCVQGHARRGPKPPVRPPGKPARPARKPAPNKPSVVRLPVGARRIVIAGVPHWFHAGTYYKLVGGAYVIVSAPVVKVLPPRHKVVVIGGIVYYLVDGVYYKTVPDGYVVVEEPAVTVAVASHTSETKQEELTLYVPRKNTDGFVPVTMKKLEGGFLGPQGEFYPLMPPIVWLTEVYGIAPELRQTKPDTFIIHVPDKAGGGFTTVALIRYESGFKGPQGEFYPHMPPVAQLTEMYGTTGDK